MPTPARRSVQALSHAVRRALMAAVLLGALCGPVAAQSTPLPTIEKKTEGMKKIPGLFNLYWDDAAGHLYWEIGDMGEEFLYVSLHGLGPGEQPDRHRPRAGPRLPRDPPHARRPARAASSSRTTSTRPTADNPTEVDAVRDAFAPSIQWGFDVVAQSGGHVLVDGTDFFLRDARGVIGQIASSGQGTFKLEKSRSAIYLPSTKSFPENTEVEAILTFTSDNPGRLVRGVAADPRGHHAPRASLLHQAPRRRLQDARRRPAHRRERPRRVRLRQAHRPGHADPAGRAPPAAEEEPGRRALRGRGADRLLRGPGHARAHQERARGGRRLVEPGVRSRRLHQRLPGEGAPRLDRPAGRPLQHDPLDAPEDARLLLRQLHRGPAHRRDHPRRREPRQSPSPPGLPARPGHGGALPRRHLVQRRRRLTSATYGTTASAPPTSPRPPTSSTSRRSRPAPTRWRWRSRACASWRPTRSGTRSASRTTTSPARTAARA